MASLPRVKSRSPCSQGAATIFRPLAWTARRALSLSTCLVYCITCVTASLMLCSPGNCPSLFPLRVRPGPLAAAHMHGRAGGKEETPVPPTPFSTCQTTSISYTQSACTYTHTHTYILHQIPVCQCFARLCSSARQASCLGPYEEHSSEAQPLHRHTSDRH